MYYVASVCRQRFYDKQLSENVQRISDFTARDSFSRELTPSKLLPSTRLWLRKYVAYHRRRQDKSSP